MEERELDAEFGHHELSPMGRLLLEVARNQFRIINRLDKVIEQNETIMATQQDLDVALQGEGTDLQSAVTAMTALEQKLASITPGQPAPDFTNEVAQVGQFRAALQGLATQIGTDTTNLGGGGTPTPTTAPAPAGSSAVQSNLRRASGTPGQ